MSVLKLYLLPKQQNSQTSNDTDVKVYFITDKGCQENNSIGII